MSFELKINAAECSVMELTALSKMFATLANPSAVEQEPVYSTKEVSMGLDTVQDEPVPTSEFVDKVNDTEVGNTFSVDKVYEEVKQIEYEVDLTDDAPIAKEEGAVDAAGFPWDERIHAGSKTTNKDGTWKLRRGVDKPLVEEIRASFTGSTRPEPEVQQKGAHEVGFGQQAGNEQAPQSAPYIQNAGAQQTVTQSPSNNIVWPQVLKMVAEAKAGGCTTEQINAAAQAQGVDTFVLLAHRPDLFTPFLCSLGLLK